MSYLVGGGTVPFINFVSVCHVACAT